MIKLVHGGSFFLVAVIILSIDEDVTSGERVFIPYGDELMMSLEAGMAVRLS